MRRWLWDFGAAAGLISVCWVLALEVPPSVFKAIDQNMAHHPFAWTAGFCGVVAAMFATWGRH